MKYPLLWVPSGVVSGVTEEADVPPADAVVGAADAWLGMLRE
jgi:hypothetical protein